MIISLFIFTYIFRVSHEWFFYVFFCCQMYSIETFLFQPLGIDSQLSSISDYPQCHRCHLHKKCLYTHKILVTPLHRLSLCQICYLEIQKEWETKIHRIQTHMSFSFWEDKKDKTFLSLDSTDGWSISYQYLVFPIVKNILYIPLTKNNQMILIPLRSFCILNDIMIPNEYIKNPSCNVFMP